VNGAAAVILEGGSGIGKTTIFQAALNSVLARGYRVLAARPAAAEAQLSYAGLSDLLTEVLPESAHALPPPQRRALEIALRVREADTAPLDPGTIGVGFLNTLRELGRLGPLVVAIDDVQWLDTPTAAVIEFAGRRLELEPVLLLTTMRLDEPDNQLNLARVIVEGRLTKLQVGPLALTALHGLIRDRAGLTLSRPDLERVHEASGGNPFYALEIARQLERSHVPSFQLAVPRDLTELVDERLDVLPRQVRRMLEAVAALAAPTVATVAAASGEQDISASLELAVAANIIVLEGERIRFTHPLLAGSAYSRMAPPRRRRLHRALASLVSDEESSARHLALGAEVPRESVAVAAEKAARSASARGAPRAAAELWELATELTPRGRSKPRRRRTFEAVQSHLRSGAVGRARFLLEELRNEMPSGPERADVLRVLASLAVYDRKAQLALIQQATSEAAGDKSRLSRVHQALGMWCTSRGDSVQALANLRTALALADASGDRDSVLLAITELLFVEEQSAQRTPGLIERATALAHRGGEVGPGYGPRLALAHVRLCGGRFLEARAMLEELLADATAHGNEPNRMNGYAALAEVECRAGEWTAALEHADAACELALQVIGAPHPWPLYAKALALAHIGRESEAQLAAEEGLAISEAADIFPRRVEHLGVLGFLELSRGDAVAADLILRPLLQELTERGWAIAPYFPSGDPLEALIGVGDADLARNYVEQFEREAAALGSQWLDASAQRLRGRLCATDGDLGGAIELFERALVAQETGGWQFERARTLLALGQARRRARQKRGAREALQAALALFEQVGAPLWAKQATVELARISGRPPASGKLTETEERVAALVAEGRTNSETAAALFLSTHTVEGHLSRIYAKLGIRSRTELAHRLATAPAVPRDA
jgi:DNA-binding CsgD family transcriptional regulator